VLQVDDIPCRGGRSGGRAGRTPAVRRDQRHARGREPLRGRRADEELAFFYRSAGPSLEPPESPTPLSSAPFPLDGIDLAIAPDLVQQVQDEFPGSEVVQVALVQLPDQGVVWGVRSRSAMGGLLNVFFSPDRRHPRRGPGRLIRPSPPTGNEGGVRGRAGVGCPNGRAPSG
jgi:hypothetical protein